MYPCRRELALSCVVGVGHEIQALAAVGSADARSAEITRPDAVRRSFQVSRNNVEPREAKR